ncbi:MAG: hypothetical protein Q9169_002048 [Polycauliona sp. 2 TL-2023]
MESLKPHLPSLSNGHILDDANHLSSSSAQLDTTPSVRKKPLGKLASKTKQATKRLLKPGSLSDEDHHLTQLADSATQGLKEDPAFDPSKLDSNYHDGQGLAAKVQTNVQTVATAILHPKEGVKSKASRSTAGRLSRIERPYISKDMDIELLEAHDNLSRAQSIASADDFLSEQSPGLSDGDLTDRIEQLEAKRESLRNARTLSRHVQRVRVVSKPCADIPKVEDFAERNSEGTHAGYDWLKWIGHYLLFHTQDFSAQYIDDFDELPFDVDNLRLQVERLAIASAPWQAFFMDMREVYRWEDPITTAKWLAVYVCLWYTQHLMGFVYGYVIYMVVKNRYFPSTVEELRISMDRANDHKGKTYNFGELVDKHGRKHWLEPLLDELGPFVQLQLNDMANMLEVFAK